MNLARTVGFFVVVGLYSPATAATIYLNTSADVNSIFTQDSNGGNVFDDIKNIKHSTIGSSSDQTATSLSNSTVPEYANAVASADASTGVLKSKTEVSAPNVGIGGSAGASGSADVQLVEYVDIVGSGTISISMAVDGFWALSSQQWTLPIPGSFSVGFQA